MARQFQIPGRFGYRHVQLIKSEAHSLGIGSYGAVYRAKCGQLPCAAKVLHPILFSTRDPSSRRIVERFEQECQFLSEMRHPNVIQHLGTCRDPENGQPVLFMELMDESLTSFLERGSARLPFHVQVNIAYDVAQALAYLHSHEVLHRDLSSNNVLMIGGSRAKVTDFGMSKLNAASHVSTPRPLTMLPGTEVYMAPEAFEEPPEYTSKLDCFSFSVLAIQIITRKFPKPGPRRKKISVPKTSYLPSGRAEVLVDEVERRKSHISLIDAHHALLLVALHCLKDVTKDRPTAEEICLRLSRLKESEKYCKKSSNLSGTAPQINADLEQAVKEAETCHKLVAEFQQSLIVKDEIIKSKDKALCQKEKEIRALKKCLEERSSQVEEENVGGGESVEPLRLQWEKELSSPVEVAGESAVVQGSTAYFCDGINRSQILKYESEMEKWDILECPKQFFSIAVVEGLLTAVGGEVSGKPTKTLLSFGENEWTEVFSQMTYYHIAPGVACTNTSLIVAGGKGPDKEMAPVEVMDTKSLCWSTATSLPYSRFHLNATVCGGRLYLSGGFPSQKSSSVLSCLVSNLVRSAISPSQTLGANSTGYKPLQQPTAVWSESAELPVKLSTLVTLQNRLLAVGGRSFDGNDVSDVLQYDPVSNSWRKIGALGLKRRLCLAAVIPNNKLLVVGGWNKDGSSLTSIEITSPVHT